MVKVISTLMFVGTILIAQQALGQSGERAPCPHIEYVQIATKQESSVIEISFEMENEENYPVEAEVRIYWPVALVQRSLPGTGSKLMPRFETRRISLQVDARPGKRRFFLPRTIGDRNDPFEFVSPLMAERTETHRLDFDSYNNSNGFHVVHCRR
jgi:hypothetical protein